jgi:acetyl-CoA acetyltransferase
MTARAAITGIGQSQVGRRLGRSPLSLTLESAIGAVRDAGLCMTDIDGVCTWPGEAFPTPGFSGTGCFEVIEALRLQVNWFTAGLEAAGQLGAIFSAYAAVATGLASNVLCFRTVWESTAQTPERRASVLGADGARASGNFRWLTPIGAVSAANRAGFLAQRRMHEFGLTREQMGWMSLNGRRNAQLNPKAVLRAPLSMDDYLGSRFISEPLCLFDCDIPVDGSTAVIVSRPDTARDLARAPIYIESVGTAGAVRPMWEQYPDINSMGAREAAASLWRRSSLSVQDVQMAQLYDGFTILAMIWLEVLGLCGRGESGPYIEGGTRIARDGQMPLNTSGGQLSAGRLHGFGFVHEACMQMRGDAGERQVAKPPEVVVVGVGGGNLSGAMLLTSDE